MRFSTKSWLRRNHLVSIVTLGYGMPGVMDLRRTFDIDIGTLLIHLKEV
jgi:hypothetical protein